MRNFSIPISDKSSNIIMIISDSYEKSPLEYYFLEILSTPTDIIVPINAIIIDPQFVKKN